MGWLLPAACCSIAIALILKYNEVRGGSRLVIAGANYLVASAISLILAGGWSGAPGAATIAIGSATGVVFALGFLLFMAAIGRGSLAIPVTVMRLSVVIPVVFAILFWRERPGFAQWLGIGIGAAAMLLAGFALRGSRGDAGRGRSYPIVIASLFVVVGTGDALLKLFREAGGGDRMLFAAILFGTAGLFIWIVVLARRLRPDGRTLLLGCLLGLPNLGSTIFTLLALRTVPASIAFPFINLAVILGSALAGFAIWRERLQPRAMAAIVLASAAIVLISRQ